MRPIFLSLLGLLIAVFATSCSTVPAKKTASAGPETTGTIEAPLINEASGLADSHRQPGVFWINNDSGGEPVLYAIDATGRYLGSVRIAGATNVDWEDDASFVLDGQPYLLAADVGDNRGQRTDCKIYIIREPDPAQLSPDRELTADIAWTVPVVYPGGPRDCEDVAVDVPSEQILLISKRTKPPVVYRLPLRPVQTLVPLVAEPVGPITTIPAPTAAQALNPYRNQPTGFDITPDGRTAVVLTYGAVYVYERKPGATWAATFAENPKILSDHHLRQAEAVCFTVDGKSIMVTTEQLPAPVLRYRLTP